MATHERRRRFSKPLLVAAASGASALIVSGCGGGSSSHTSKPPGGYCNGLVPPEVTLCIDADPAAAIVEVNGAVAGHCTTIVTSESEDCHGDLRITPANVTVKAVGYKAYAETVDLSEGPTIHQSVKLEPTD